MPSASEGRAPIESKPPVNEEGMDAPGVCDLDSISRGASPGQWDEVIDVFWEAFGWKLQSAPFIRRRPQQGRALAAALIDPRTAYVALDENDRVLGVAFVAPVGTILDPDPDAVGEAFGGLLGVAARSWAQRRHTHVAGREAVSGGVVAFEGFGVRLECRGKGVGSAVLERVVSDARAEGRSAIQLTVGDTNEGARRLYEREGFRQTKSAWLGPLVSGAGFKRLLTYELEL